MTDDMATMPIRDLIEALRDKVQKMEPLHALVFGVMTNRLEQQADIIDGLIDPGWDDFMAILDNWLQHYPADIFTGESGDPGALFIVAVRKAYEDLLEAQGGLVITPVGTRPREPDAD